MISQEITERLERLSSRGPAPVGVILIIFLSLTAEQPVAVLAWMAFELAIQGFLINRAIVRWPQHVRIFHVLRIVLAVSSLMLLPQWAGPECPVWLWAATSIPPQFALFRLRRAAINSVVLVCAALAGQWISGVSLAALQMPALILVLLVLGVAPFTLSLQSLVIQERADAVNLRTFRRVIEQAGEGLGIADADAKMVFVNPAWQKLTGIDAADAIGRTPRELLRQPNTDPAIYQEIERILRQGGTWAGNMKSETRAGKKLETHLTVSGVMLDGELTHFVEVRSDVRERNRIVAELESAREAAEAANRAKSDFLANVSHEIRTPMNGVVGMVSLLAQGELSPEQAEQVRTIRTSAESLLEIIQKVLDFASIEAGRLELYKTAFELAELCDSVTAMIRVLPTARNLEIRCELEPSLPQWVKGDVTRLRQVLTNLMANGAKFTSTGSVTLKVRRGGQDSIMFSVSDTGQGIAQEALSKVFEPFFQASARGPMRPRGTGLGLAICNQIIQAMGARMHVDSEVGEGTTFSFEVPLPRCEPTVPEVAVIEEQSLPLASCRILVAEDDRVTQRMMKLLLKRLGHEAHVVSNGREALGALEEEAYDLVLMDCQMPVMDGLEATRTIRAAEEGDAQVVLGLSADVRPEHVEICKIAGMNAVFFKPISLEKLRDICSRWLPLEQETALQGGAAQVQSGAPARES